MKKKFSVANGRLATLGPNRGVFSIHFPTMAGGAACYGMHA